MFPTTATKLLEMEYEDAEELIKTEAKTLQDQSIAASGHVLRGDPADMITNAANAGNVDLIILATHGKTGMKAFWEGSVAHRICSFSRVPLLLAPITEK